MEDLYVVCFIFFVESKYLAKFLLWPLLSYSYEPLCKIVIVTWFRYDQVLQFSFIIKCPQMIIYNLKPICVTILWSESPGWAEVLLKCRLLRLVQHTICVAWGSQAGSCNPAWKPKVFFFPLFMLILNQPWSWHWNYEPIHVYEVLLVSGWAKGRVFLRNCGGSSPPPAATR